MDMSEIDLRRWWWVAEDFLQGKQLIDTVE